VTTLQSRSTESCIAIRPATREDQSRIQALVRGLTPRSRYLRFFSGIQELTQPWLERFSRADPRSDFSLLALARKGGAAVGMAQYSADPYPGRADIAVVVADRWQGVGLGKELVRRVVTAARAAGVQRIEGEVLAENRAMLDLLRSLGFRLRRHPEGALLQFQL
jgi:RimJ/RimL family protein N-acetyltransferase